LNHRGIASGSMGVDTADINTDGIDDLLITDYADQFPMFFFSDGFIGYTDNIMRTGVGRPVLPHVNWGLGFADFDLDRDRDVYICNGHFLRNVRDIDPRTQFRVPNVLLVNNGAGRYRADAVSQPVDAMPESSRGAVFDDLDNDGDVDIAILNFAASAQVLRCQAPAERHWIELQLVGTHANRDGVGARVTIQTQSHEQSAEVHAGRGYQSHFGSRLHFGLGDAVNATNLRVAWPSGKTQTLTDVPSNQILTIVEQ
ncbi:MAG: ASPIC/UnbV domain-containing protein, partial [Planctomycetales bacterium]|nr:ASPIC/UnbV domain-containing protein [Planctomycetales bacterium]